MKCSARWKMHIQSSSIWRSWTMKSWNVFARTIWRSLKRHVKIYGGARMTAGCPSYNHCSSVPFMEERTEEVNDEYESLYGNGCNVRAGEGDCAQVGEDR